jgi:hypothetical protein
MSFVIDVADDELRDAFLRTCRRHVADGGCVILQRKPPEWYDSVEPFEEAIDDRVVRMTDISRPGPGLLAATMEYTVGERRWTHTFVSKRLEDDDLEAALGRAGLTMAGFLDGDRGWVRAVPAGVGARS